LLLAISEYTILCAPLTVQANSIFYLLQIEVHAAIDRGDRSDGLLDISLDLLAFGLCYLEQLLPLLSKLVELLRLKLCVILESEDFVGDLVDFAA